MPSEVSNLLGSSSSAKKAYIQPLTLVWRIMHTIPYLIGGFTFFLGSCQYFPWINNFVLGGWLFTIGSAGFLFADCNEWWMNNKVGCVCDSEYTEDFERNVGRYYEAPHTCYGRLQRAENGLNFAFSAFGSFLYLLGSILFIPRYDAMVLGTQIFIPGSLVIFISQTWKVYRAGCFNELSPYDKSFRPRNLFQDLPAFGVDVCAGLGGFAYMVGSYLFLPEIAVDEDATTRAAMTFVIGGTLFSISGVCLAYRYFITENYPH
jgi:hypothetical protein